MYKPTADVLSDLIVVTWVILWRRDQNVFVDQIVITFILSLGIIHYHQYEMGMGYKFSNRVSRKSSLMGLWQLMKIRYYTMMLEGNDGGRIGINTPEPADRGSAVCIDKGWLPICFRKHRESLLKNRIFHSSRVFKWKKYMKKWTSKNVVSHTSPPLLMYTD